MGLLEGRVAIVTGAGSGIGRAMAHGLAREGAALVVADLAADRAELVASEIAGTGAQAMAREVDVSDSAAVDAMVAAAVERFGALDVLINNAGAAEAAIVAEMRDEQWDRVIAVNLRGTFACSRAAVRAMTPRRWGRIVNVASGLGLRGAPGASVYAASKAAIINFTRSLALEVARQGITVNAIGPGVTDTPFWRQHRTQEEIDATLATGRIGRPEDFVPVVTFLCSEAGGAHTALMIDRDIFMPRGQP